MRGNSVPLVSIELFYTSTNRIRFQRSLTANCGHSALRLSFPKAAIVPRMATLRGQVSVRIDARRPVGRQCSLGVRRDEGAGG